MVPCAIDSVVRNTKPFRVVVMWGNALLLLEPFFIVHHGYLLSHLLFILVVSFGLSVLFRSLLSWSCRK
ncbi:hypothetical protein V8C44DRAFT_342801 [Trichoderma aethiopicum]